MKKLLITLAALITAASAFAGHYVTFIPGESPEPDIYNWGAGITLNEVRITFQGQNFSVTDEAYNYNALGDYLQVWALNSDERLMSIEFISTSGIYNGNYQASTTEYPEERGRITTTSNSVLWQDGYTTEDGTFIPYTEEDYNNGVVSDFDQAFSSTYYENGMEGCRFDCFGEISISEIRVYVWNKNDEPPVEPTEKTGAPVFNGYTTDGIHAYFVEIQESEPSTIYFRVQYGQNGEFTEWAEYEDILSFTQDGWYRIEAYAVADGKLPSDPIAYEFVVSPSTGIDEMMSSKQVAGTRYFNMAGQEMQQANGMTIVVTTYTDGTTNATKVMK